jgi:hypothetical protein
MAYHGAVDVYATLCELGIKFDIKLLTKDGNESETAEQVAVRHGHSEFAELMAYDTAGIASSSPGLVAGIYG